MTTDSTATSPASPAKGTEQPKAAHKHCETCGYVFAKPRQAGKCGTKTACDKRAIENAAAGIDAAKRARQGGQLTDAQKAKIAKAAAKA